MKIRTVMLILALAGIVISCIPSLYPLYREKDLLLDKRLEGRYDAEDGDYWEFSHLDINNPEVMSGNWKQYQSGFTYKLSVMEDGRIEDFATHLLKLGDEHYLDFMPVGYTIEPDLLEMSLAPSHIFAKVELLEDGIILHFFDLDWLEELIEEDRIRISHLQLNDGRYLLAAKTDELQKFILKFANDSTTFMEADTLPRVSVSRVATGNWNPIELTLTN